MKLVKQYLKRIKNHRNKINKLETYIDFEFKNLNSVVAEKKYLKQFNRWGELSRIMKVSLAKTGDIFGEIVDFYENTDGTVISSIYMKKSYNPVNNYELLEVATKKEFNTAVKQAKKDNEDLLIKCKEFGEWAKKYKAVREHEEIPNYFNTTDKNGRYFRITNEKIEVGETNLFFDRWANSRVAEIYFPISEKEFHKIMKTLPNQKSIFDDILQFNKEK